MAKIKGWSYEGHISLSPGLAKQYMWGSKKGKIILIDKNWNMEISNDDGLVFQKHFKTKKDAFNYVRTFMKRHPNG